MFRCSLGTRALLARGPRGDTRMERRSQSLTSSGTAPGDLMLPATTEPWPEFPQAEPSVAGSNGTETPEAATPGGETPVAGAQGTEPTAAATPGGETPQDETPGTEPANGPDDTVVFALPIRPQGPGPQVPAMPRPAKPPSWARVLATTLRLWAQRRFRRRSQPDRYRRARYCHDGPRPSGELGRQPGRCGRDCGV